MRTYSFYRRIRQAVFKKGFAPVIYSGFF